MTWKYEGEEIDEEFIGEIIYDIFTEDDFENYLNDEYAPIDLLGRSYEYGYAFRYIDEGEFSSAYCEHMGDMYDTIITTKDGYSWIEGLEWVDDE